MSLDHILVGMLSEQPASGYDLKTQFAAGARLFWNAELSQIYPALKRLEKKGWLRSGLGDSKRGPQRRVYRVTAEGREHLKRWLREPPHVSEDRFAYIAQANFMGELDDLEATERFLGSIASVWRTRLEMVTQLEREVAAIQTPDVKTFHQLSAIRLGVHQLTAKIAWTDETLRDVRQRRQRESSTLPNRQRDGRKRRKGSA